MSQVTSGRWAGTTILDGLPINGHRVAAHWINDESLYWNFDEDTYDGLI